MKGINLIRKLVLCCFLAMSLAYASGQTEIADPDVTGGGGGGGVGGGTVTCGSCTCTGTTTTCEESCHEECTLWIFSCHQVCSCKCTAA